MSARIDLAAAPLRPPVANHAGHGAGRFGEVLARALGDLDRSAANASPPTAGALDTRGALELQIAVYRHAERVELTSRLIDHGLSAVKTVLQTRV